MSKNRNIKLGGKPIELTFRSTDGMKSYRDLPTPWVNGTTREVADVKGKYLLKNFPLNFFLSGVAAQNAQAAEEAARLKAEAAAKAPPAGDPNAASQTAGDTTGAAIGELTDEQVELYKSACDKIDKKEELTAEEQAVVDIVEAMDSED